MKARDGVGVFGSARGVRPSRARERLDLGSTYDPPRRQHRHGQPWATSFGYVSTATCYDGSGRCTSSAATTGRPRRAVDVPLALLLLLLLLPLVVFASNRRRRDAVPVDHNPRTRRSSFPPRWVHPKSKSKSQSPEHSHGTVEFTSGEVDDRPALGRPPREFRRR